MIPRGCGMFALSIAIFRLASFAPIPGVVPAKAGTHHPWR